MTDLTAFNFQGHGVRVVADEHGEPWFVAKDVLAILDLNRSSLVALDDDEKGVHSMYSPGGDQNVTIVSEPGLYSLILRSRKNEAKAFKRWLLRDVLPSIRRTGSYGTPALTGPALMAAALIEAQATLDAATARVAQLEPKAAYVDTFVADDDLRLIRNVAKSLDVQEKALRAALVEHGWIYAEHSSRFSEREQRKVPQIRYSPSADKRAYFRPVPAHDAPRFRGEVDHTLKVTPAGAAAIARNAARWGLVAREDAA